jgi:hypothetical protein
VCKSDEVRLAEQADQDRRLAGKFLELRTRRRLVSTRGAAAELAVLVDQVPAIAIASALERD